MLSVNTPGAWNRCLIESKAFILPDLVNFAVKFTFTSRSPQFDSSRFTSLKRCLGSCADHLFFDTSSQPKGKNRGFPCNSRVYGGSTLYFYDWCTCYSFSDDHGISKGFLLTVPDDSGNLSICIQVVARDKTIANYSGLCFNHLVSLSNKGCFREWNTIFVVFYLPINSHI